MNTDIRFSCNVFENHKIIKLERRLGAEGIVSLFKLWAWVAKNRPNGILTNMDLEDVEIIARWNGQNNNFLNTCVDLRLVEVDQNGEVAIHDWAENQPWACEAEKRSQKARKAARAKWSKDDSGTANNQDRSEKTHASSNAKSCSEHASSNARSNAPLLSSPNLSSPFLSGENITSPVQENAPTTSEEVSQPKRPTCPHQQIIDIFHEVCPTLPKVKSWGTTRQKNLRARWNEDQDRQNIDWWRDFFVGVSSSEFLTGKVEGSRGPFFASLDWLVRPTNFEKVIEGKYSNRKKRAEELSREELVRMGPEALLPDSMKGLFGGSLRGDFIEAEVLSSDD